MSLPPDSSGGAAADTLAGGGEMGALMRAIDWSRTPVGPVESWPQSLRTAVSIILASRFPMYVAWGPEYTQFYNDGFRPILGATKHPAAMGGSTAVTFAEGWEVVGPMFEGVRRGEAVWNEDWMLPLDRNGYLEECYFTFSYSPIRDESAGVGGVLVTVTETTRRVLGERRLRTLRNLARAASEAKTSREACEATAAVLADGSHDVPFGLVYLLDEAGAALTLAGVAGLPPDSAARVDCIALDPAAPQPWPLAAAARGEPIVVPDVSARFGPLPGGAWPETPQTAVVLPIARPDHPPYGVLVAGISARRALDDDYRDFLDLVADHVATAIANARAHEEERQRAEALAEIDRAKTRFFSNVSHEFRTPLTLILGPLADLLASRELPDHAAESLAAVHRNAQRLLRLVNTLLDFSRIEAGRIQATYRPTDLGVLTADLASSFRAAVEKAGLSLHVHVEREGPVVHVDREMWEKVILNLLSNAFKFTFRGEIEVRVTYSASEALVSVRDTGLGVPAEQVPHLFERFYRVEGARGRTHEGTGIGLALVQELVRLHGGRIEVDSTEGVGTTFRMALPLGTAHLPADRVAADPAEQTASTLGAAFVDEALRWLPDEAPPGEGAPAEPAASPVPGVRARVLVADDNADMREYVRRLLSPRFDVRLAADGRAALAALEHWPADLVLADIMMPNLDGFGLLQAIRADERLRSLPVLLLSARAGEESRVEGIEAGADDYLVKPFGARELVARVATHVQIGRLRREAVARGEAIRESEERYRLAARATNDVIWDWNMRTGEVVWNDALQTVFGYAPLDPGRHIDEALPWWLERIHPDDREEVERTFAAVPTMAEDQWTAEYRFRRSNGEYAMVLDRGYIGRDADGRPQRIVGSMLDLTDQMRTEAALRDADRRKDEFLAMLAHELRNPLAPITTGLSLLKAGAEPALAEQVRQMIDRQLGHLVRLVDDLLELSRITLGKIELRFEPTPLADLIERAVESVRPALAARGQRLDVDAPGEAAWVHVDPVRFTQVVANLLSNAAKYSEPGGRVRLQVRIAGGQVEVRVADEGLGLTAEERARVFDLFAQMPRAADRSREGLGIGLTLVRQLVELHGGHVEARSDGPGRGSEFVVRLPVVTTERPAPPPAASAPRTVTSRTVLVVDDNEDSADMVATLLRLHGHVVRVAYDGQGAIDGYREETPDVVLLDLDLPGVSGIEVARAIRRLPGRRATIIAMTGHGREQDRRRAREAGFDHHLVKPVDPDALTRLIAGPGAGDPTTA